jgi:hypothetical protein
MVAGAAKAAASWVTAGTISRLKIMIGWVQCLGAFSFTFSVPWPRSFQSQLDTLYAAFSIDVWGIFSMSDFFAGWDCLLGMQFTTGFWVSMLTLPLLASLITMAGCIALFQSHSGSLARVGFKKPSKLSTIRIRGTKIFVSAVFLLYPSLCSKVFRIFNPRTIGEVRYLNDDLTIEFNSAEHNHLKLYAWVFMLVYVIGIPSMTLLILWKHRHGIKEGTQGRLVDYEFGQLFLYYEPRCWYFEVIELCRKMLLTGGLIVVAPGSLAQIAIGTLVCLAHLLICTNVGPLVDSLDDVLQQLTSLQLLCSLQIAVLLKANQSGPASDGGNEDSIMSALLMAMLILSYLFSVIAFWLSFGSLEDYVMSSLGRIASIGVPLLRVFRLVVRGDKRTKKKAPTSAAAVAPLSTKADDVDICAEAKTDSIVEDEPKPEVPAPAPASAPTPPRQVEE